MKMDDLINLCVSNELVTIRRYREDDFASLEKIFNKDLFAWFFTNYDSCRDFVDEKMQDFADGKLIMYVIIDNKTAQIIGTSSLYEISLRHKRLEMGASWLSKYYHGSAYNSTAKYLLIETLIEKFGFNRIQWKTDALNEKSKTAMSKLGFVYEGTLNRHAVTASGRVRDSLVFAVTDVTWSDVKLLMQSRIQVKLTN